MQTILTDAADRAGWHTGCVQRAAAKLTGRICTQTLLFGLGANPQASLGALTQTSAALGVEVTPEALHQRCDRAAASTLQQVLCAAVRQVVAVDPMVLPILDRFPEVVVQDSTVISLPEALVDVWQGCGNGTPQAGTAALKLHLALDLRSGRLRGPSLHPGRAPDTAATREHALSAGAVRLVDLGCWDLALLGRLRPRGVFWFSRMHAMTAVQTAAGQWWQLLALRNATPAARLDLAVRRGREDQVAARLIAVRAPPEVVDQRRRRLRQEAKQKGEMVSALRLALAAGSVFVTTIPSERLRVDEALILGRARWQIELLIQLWKSHGQLDLVREVQPWRVLCERYGRLLGQIVPHWLLVISGWEDTARSLPKAAQTIRTHWLTLAGAMPTHPRLVEAISTVARCLQAGCRMNRRKKHPNTYQGFLAATESCVI